MDGFRSTFIPITTLGPGSFNSTIQPFTLAVNDSGQSQNKCDFTKTEFVGYFFVQPIICFLGTLLNVISFGIFARGKQFAGHPTYRLMMVLALFDALTLLLTLPSSFIRCKPYLATCTTRLFKKIRMNLYVMQTRALYPLINMSEAISVTVTVLLSIERYLSIKHNYIIKAYFSPSNVRNLILLLIGICFVIHIPLFFVQYSKPVYETVNTTALNATWAALNGSESLPSPKPRLTYYQGVLTKFGKSPFYEIYTWTRISIFNFAPLVFLAVINAFLIYIVRNSGHFRKQSSQTRAAEKRLKGQRNLTILLVIVIFLFLAGQIPLAFAFVSVFEMVTGCKEACCFFYNNYRVVTNDVSLLTYGANFFVYLALNKHFRAEVSRTCSCLTKSRRGTPVEGTEGMKMLARTAREREITLVTEDNGEIEPES